MKSNSSLDAQRALHLEIARSILAPVHRDAIRVYRTKSNVTIRPTRAFPNIAFEIRHSEAKSEIEPPAGPFIAIRHTIGKRNMHSTVGRYGVNFSAIVPMKDFDAHAQAVSAAIKAMLAHTKGPQWR